MTPTVLVTGASRGIGLATCRALLEIHNANVIAMSRNGSAELDELAGVRQGGLLITHGDVAKDEDNQAAVQAGLRLFSQLDAVVLSASTIDPIKRIADADLDDVRRCFEANTYSVFSVLKHALPYLRRNGGRVIVVSSGAATGSTSAWGAYSASKAAVNSIVRTLANEESDVTAISFRPGTVRTTMQEQIRAQGEGNMHAAELDRFMELHTDDKLTLPDVPGAILANLALKAEKSLSGQFISWDSDECKPYRQ